MSRDTGELYLTVHYRDQFVVHHETIEIPSVFMEQFKKLKTNTCDPMIAYACGEVTAGSATAEVVIKQRRDTAEILAKEITEFLMQAMSKHDTINGYRVDDNT